LYYIISSTQKPFSITFNGDGINDEFNLNSLIENCLEFELLIFNRWGNLVFKSKNNEDIFKGYDLNNKELTQGVYFYKIVSKNHVKHGTITIVK
jgi:gliding motility-associated-like protein